MGKSFALFACSLMNTEVLTHSLQYLSVKNHKLLCLTPPRAAEGSKHKVNGRWHSRSNADEIMLI